MPKRRGVPRLIERVRAVAFDLDGTLVDSAPDLAMAANGMLETLGHVPLPESRIRMRIGDGVDRLVEAVLTERAGEVPAATLAAAAEVFRTLYARHLCARSRVYPGVLHCLETLRAMGMHQGCVTNKHSLFTLPLLEALQLTRFLEFVLCADRAEQRKPRPDLLNAACKHVNIAPHELLYVGDSRVDIAAARAAGCSVAAVDYGYNQGRPLAAEGPDWIISSLTEILGLQAQMDPA
jgi:phosphoglycolate phosphatase